MKDNKKFKEELYVDTSKYNKGRDKEDKNIKSLEKNNDDIMKKIGDNARKALEIIAGEEKR